MRIEPTHQPPRPVALVTPGWQACRVQTRDEDRFLHGAPRVRTALAELSGHAVYARGLLGLLHTTGATQWQATSWKGRAVSMTLDGTRTQVLSLRDTLGDGPGDEQLQGLLTATDWLAGHGVRAGSLSSMAWHLWTSTLAEPLHIASLPQIGQAAFYGPRQEVREPRTYSHMACVDTTSAYPAAMASRPFALTLREVSNGTDLNPTVAGLAHATVAIPSELPFSPLPIRVADGVIQWRTGILDGYWTWNELYGARSLGCRVLVERNFAPAIESQPFDRWFRILQEGRALPGSAGALIKAVGTALWGMFAMAGDHTATVRWRDDQGEEPIIVKRSRRRLPQASTAHIAAEVAARVRTQTLTEVYKMSAYPVHIDTDGVIVRRSAARPYPTTSAPGEWRRKTVMRKVEVRAPQLYRYKCDQDCCWTSTHWHYVAAGMCESRAIELFERAHPTRVSILNGHDTVLPPSHAWELAKLAPWISEARGLRLALFGPGLDR
jgi:hypothetical protein